MPPNQPGHFIVLDGPEGAGKSTQVCELAEALGLQGHEVVMTVEPGGTPVGNGIRELFLSGEHEAMTPLTELFLICAARAQHVADVISPAIEAGQIVLCDRFSPSTYAYQAHAGSVEGRTVQRTDTAARQGLDPDLTIILDVPAEVGLARRLAASEADRMEAKGIEFHERVRQGYLRYVEVAPETCVVVDGQASEDDVHEQILGHVLKCVGTAGR